MSVGIIKIVCLLATDGPIGPNPKAAQAMLFMLGGISFMFWTVTITMNITICLLFFLLTVTCILLSFGVQDEAVDTVGGYFGMITSANAFWLAYAVLVNEVLGKGTEIIPLGQLKWEKLFQRCAEHQPPVPAGFSTACHVTDDSIANSDIEEAQDTSLAC
jgi:succinate-acetate transporter protein